ncbi:MAG: hypothetical protein L6Q92_07265 [Phycisphaerae bacterium]|nr:hypothetical protein [Phycisphaerae bacterium]
MTHPQTALSENPLQITPLLGALAGGGIGALAWGLIAAKTGYEVGYVAWGVGILVAVGAKLLGGRGTLTAGACAVIALGSIFAGKMLAVNYTVLDMLDGATATLTSREFYELEMQKAEKFALLTSEDEYPAFMVEYGYTDEAKAEDVPAEEVAAFKEDMVERLKRLRAESPSYEDWKADQEKNLSNIVPDSRGLARAAISELGVIDIIFALLGLSTAYKIVSGAAVSET